MPFTRSLYGPTTCHVHDHACTSACAHSLPIRALAVARRHEGVRPHNLCQPARYVPCTRRHPCLRLAPVEMAPPEQPETPRRALQSGSPPPPPPPCARMVTRTRGGIQPPLTGQRWRAAAGWWTGAHLSTQPPPRQPPLKWRPPGPKTPSQACIRHRLPRRQTPRQSVDITFQLAPARTSPRGSWPPGGPNPSSQKKPPLGRCTAQGRIAAVAARLAACITSKSLPSCRRCRAPRPGASPPPRLAHP